MDLCKEKCEWCRFGNKVHSEVVSIDLEYDDQVMTKTEYAEYYCGSKKNANFGKRFPREVRRRLGPPWIKKYIPKKWMHT